MNVYEPMDVTIETDDDGSTGPSPSCNPEWTRIDQLRWHAGIIKARTGVEVRFVDSNKASGPGYTYEWPQLIGVLIRGSDYSSSHSEFDSSIDTYLRGLEAGAEAAQVTRERTDA